MNDLKKYQKPIIEDEDIKLEDICSESLTNGEKLMTFKGDESFRG